jgi:hypothetical protein
MLIKIMSSQDLPDTANDKLFELFSDVVTFDIQRDGPTLDYPVCYIRQRHHKEPGDHVARRLFGNVYIMNDDGKTIETFYPTRGETGAVTNVRGFAKKK